MKPRADKPRGHALRTVLAWIVLCAAGSVIVLVGVEVPGWMRKAGELPTRKDQLEAQNQIVTTLIQLAGGLVVVTGLYFTARTIYVSQEGQITERFNKAIDHLGADKLAMRLGGIYALARIAADSPKDAATIVEIFAAFLRESATEVGAKTAADGKAILVLLGTAEWARAAVVDLRGCRFQEVSAEGLDFENALLDDAVFRDCRLPQGRFDGASLLAADFANCYLRQCSFKGCHARVANFAGAYLRGASFEGADIFGAKFDSASLLAANFDGAAGAIRQQFEDAVVDESTKLPEFKALEGPAESS